MDKLQIQGGTPLHGEVVVSGAKNAALPILTAALLSAKPVELHNVPRLNDVGSMLRLLQQLGVKATHLNDHALVLDAGSVSDLTAPYEIVKTMRASILVLGPLLARFGKASVSLPGGCAIGSRPVDQHIKGLQAMGAQIEISHGYINASAPGGKLRGARIRTDMITVTGTENLLMAATLAQGITILENAAREPEVVDLANLLVKMGARIEGIGTDHLVVEGVDQLHGAQHTVIADRIEAGTFLCAVAAAGGDITLRNAHPDSMGPTLDKLQQAGLQLEIGADWIRARAQQRMNAVNIRTQEHPGFPTDMQAQLMAVNCVANGTSVITETIFENRFMHVQELIRLGADINIEGNTAVVKGMPQLSGANVMATDLRASACLVIAGLVSEGTTVVDRIYHLDRGYERMEEKLRALGARIERVQ